MTKNLAIIPARGGSKRIPRKNIKEFLGKPIISYSIEAALNSCLFDEVMVSTEDEEIAGIAKDMGAEVPFYRSSDTSSDYATTAEVILEVIEEYRKRGSEFDNICCIYPTAPFVTIEKLVLSMDLLLKEKTESVFPVVKYSYPPQRALIINDNKMRMRYPENFILRSQDLEYWYHDCGQFYCIKTNSFIQTKSFLTENTIPIVVSELETQDIDSEEDWILAEMKYMQMMGKVYRGGE